ncbi:hypothetical protein FB474_2707 [Oryzihumus leptocrescens]|uniref:Uncharacterized protein n=1 Tax=Oryzihumus leptocrescens TaxID=297536 RepID=A0A542ZLZ6_9MICO|nr:hypothetical protein FB474_2707 [Oryzihumus leptocrescens]
MQVTVWPGSQSLPKSGYPTVVSAQPTHDREPVSPT